MVRDDGCYVGCRTYHHRSHASQQLPTMAMIHSYKVMWVNSNSRASIQLMAAQPPFAGDSGSV